MASRYLLMVQQTFFLICLLTNYLQNTFSMDFFRINKATLMFYILSKKISNWGSGGGLDEFSIQQMD